MTITKVHINSTFIFISLLVASCVMETRNTVSEARDMFHKSNVNIDLPEILKRDTLTVLFENSSTSYFIYRGKKMGFEFELLRLFAEDIGVELEVKVVQNLDSLIDMLNRGEGDLIACNYTITKGRNRLINFSEPFLNTHQVLVQRKPDDWKSKKQKEWVKEMIQTPSDLGEKHIHVWKNSSYHQRLIHLQEEIGDTIYIEGIEGNIGGEELIEMVAEGLIDYTIIEDNIANVNTQFFDNLYIDLGISFDQKIAFGLRKKSPLLKAKLDEWLLKIKDERIFKHIYRKYFEIRHIINNTSYGNFVALNGKQISPFDQHFKSAAEKTGWDWRMIASVAYQESKFNPNIQGFGGSYGMMQFMPNTGPTYGVYPDSSPEIQIHGGARKLAADEKFWKVIPDEIQRKKFSLASYNAGRGHILDAQRLAKKHGFNHLVWDDNVEKMLLNLSKQKFYQDEVVRHGMLRSKTTYKYVRSVIERYNEWIAIYK